MTKLGVSPKKEVSMVAGLKLEVFYEDEPNVEESFRLLVGHLMWLANQSRQDILHTVRAVTRYSHAPKGVHWKAMFDMAMYHFSEG